MRDINTLVNYTIIQLHELLLSARGLNLSTDERDYGFRDLSKIEIPISQLKMSKNLEVSHQAISKLLKRGIECGLLTCANPKHKWQYSADDFDYKVVDRKTGEEVAFDSIKDFYRLRAKKRRYCSTRTLKPGAVRVHSKTYHVNPEMLKELKRLYDAIPDWRKKIKYRFQIVQLQRFNPELKERRRRRGRPRKDEKKSDGDKSKVRFGRRLCAGRLSERMIKDAVHENMPLMYATEGYIKECNEAYNHDSRFMIHMGYNIETSKRKKSLMKLSTRVYSDVCSTSKKDNTRYDFFKKYFGANVPVYEYDVKSSCPRVMHLFNTGKWADSSVDFYTLMNPDTSFISRECFKALAQSIEFCLTDSGSARSIANRLCAVDEESVLDELRAKSDEEVVKYVADAINQFHRVMGEQRMDIDVFMHESAIYVRMLYYLLKMGYKCMLVYDCFYSDCENIEEICEEVLPQIAEQYYNDWHNQKRAVRRYYSTRGGRRAMRRDNVRI